MTHELQVVAPRGVARSFDAATLAGEWRDHLAALVAAGAMAQTTADTYGRGMTKLLASIGGHDVTRVGPQAYAPGGCLVAVGRASWRGAAAGAGGLPMRAAHSAMGPLQSLSTRLCRGGLSADPSACGA